MTLMSPARCQGKNFKYNLRIAAQEMNIVPGLHLATVSVPKLADVGYTTKLTKNGTAIYNDNTTAITASNPPILESDWRQHTGMWRLNLDPKNTSTPSLDSQHANPRGSMSTLISQAHAKLFFGTTHQQDSHQKKHSLMPSTTDTAQHGQN
jgi:hypothetical protein